MVNNFELIRSMLQFNEPGQFYFLQLLQRRKDNPNLEKDMKVIKDFYIYSLEEFDSLKPSIIELCNKHNARAYFRLNRREDKKINLQLIKRITELATNANYESIRELRDLTIECFDCKITDSEFPFYIIQAAITQILLGDKSYFKRVFASIAGEFHSDPDKTWIVDIDWIDFDDRPGELEELESIIRQLQIETGREPRMDKIPTKNGFHWVTRPFNLQKLRELYPYKLDMHKDNPSLLYIP